MQFIESIMPFSRQVFSGFPFDRDDFSGRSTHFRSRLDDLAQRHPEFAEHLQDFPFSGSSRSRLNQHRTPTDFYSRFDHFPFEDFEQQQFHPQHQQSGPTEEPKEKSQQVPKEEEKQQQQQRGRKVQQSNTVDLGQKQQESADLVNDRQQRSMSAPPPENRRFVNSINIQLNQPNEQQQQQASGGEEMGQSKSTKPQERVIPILVEGRDEPVLPKTYHQQQQQPPQQQQQPQAERIFGQRPEQFTKFVPKRNIDEEMWRQQQEYKRQEEKFHQQQQQEEPVQQPPQKPKTPIDQIKDIQKNVNELMLQVEQFNGKPKDKQYLYLDEMLTQNLIKLDNIDTQGQEIIRTARKEAIKCIEKCLAVLEAKATANVQLTAQQTVVESEEKMETTVGEQKDVPPPQDGAAANGQEKMEVVVAEENKKNEEKSEQQNEQMEVAVPEQQQSNVEEVKEETKTSETPETKAAN